MTISEQDTFEIDFFEAISKRAPKDTETLELLGCLYSKNGLTNKAYQIDRKLARLLPTDARVRYNLACSLCLIGRKRDAVGTLAKALDLGYSDISWLQKDPDLDKLRGYPDFEDLLQNLKA